MAVSPPPVHVSISLSHSLPPSSSSSSSSPGAGPSSPIAPDAEQSTNAQKKTFRRLRTSLEHTLRAAAAAGARSRREQQPHSSHPQQPPALSASSPNPASRIPHQKPSASDSTTTNTHYSPTAPLSAQPHKAGAAAAASLPMPPPAPSQKGKHRASVDFVGIERSRDRERERERERERRRVSEEREREKLAAPVTVAVASDRTSTSHTSRFSGGLRKLESKVGLRRLSSREATRPEVITSAGAPVTATTTSSHSSSPPLSISISGPTKLRKERDKSIKDRDRDRDKKEKEDPTTTRTRSKKWSFLAPSLTSHPSASTSALDVSTSTTSTSTTRRDRDRDREEEKETVRASSPLPPPPPPRKRTPPSPSPPPRISPTESRSRIKLTSPSSPSLSSPSSSASPTLSNGAASTPNTTPSPGIAPVPSPAPPLAPRTRPRPAPIQSTSHSAGTSSSTSSSPHTLSRSVTNPIPTRSIPPSPTTPTSLASQSQTPRNASPIPPRPSRPPLSPSAGVNAASRLRLRTAMSQPGGSGIRSASTTSLPMEPSSLSSSSSVAEKEKPPERPERRRPSVGTVTTVTNGNGTGRTTATGSPSHAAPTSSSRSRAESTRAQSLEREREKQQLQQLQQQQQAQTRSRASASASSLVLSRAEADRSRSPSQSGAGAGVVRRATSPAPPLPAGHRDVIRHAASLLLRELDGPRPRALPRSPSSPSSSSQPTTPLQALFPSSTSAPTLAQEAWTPEIWDECEARLRLLARAERVRLGGPYGGSAVSLVGAGAVVGSVNPAGEERERRVFAEAVRDGYILCQLANKLRPGTIPRVDPYEDGFKSSSNATKFLAAAAGPFGIPASELFERDDLIKSTPDALFRVARAIVAVVARAGEDAAAERVARKILLGGGQAREEKRPTNSPYGTRAKGASSSTPNLSTLQRSASPPALSSSPGLRRKVKRWSPPSPALSTVAGEDTGSGTVSPDPANSSKAGSTSGKRSKSNKSKERQKEGDGSRSGSGASANTEIQSARSRLPLKGKLEDESALATDSGSDSDVEEDANEKFYDAASHHKTHSTLSIAPAVPPKPSAIPPVPPIPGRVSLASETTQTTQSTAPSSLLAASRPRDSTGGERASTQFGTIRTATTVATSVAPSENYRADVSVRGSASEASASVSLWDEISSNSAQSSGFVVSSSLLKKPQLRDRRPSEAAVIDLSRVAEEAEDGTAAAGGAGGSSGEAAPEPKRRPQAIQLGKGKWPDDFVQAFKSGSPPRSSPGSGSGIAFHRAEAERVLSSSPLAASPPRLASHLLKNAEGNDSAESLPQLPQRRPLHRPRHSIDAPVLRPKEPPFIRDRDNSNGGPEGASSSRIIPKRTNSANRHGVYVPRGDSASPNPSPDASVSARVPFPRAVSGEHPVNAEISATTAAASAAQQSRYSRGRFQSDVDAGSRRRPRPNSYDELGAKPHRSRIESMVSIGGASSSNFSASDIRSSMDGSAMRKTLIIRDEGKPTTHFQLGNCIGRGQFGSVYRALNLNNGQMVAVKRIRLEGLSEEDVKQLMREVETVKSLSHPSIVKYEGMSKDSDTLNIVLEYAENGSLGQTLKAFGKLNEKLVATYVIKILEGLDYLHRNDVVHCDLKAANILTTKTGNVKLSDFGVSLNLRKVGRDHKTDVTGTPNWMAPEVIELKGASRASDIWSLGCTVIELLTGRPPYADIPNGMSVMYRIVDDPMPPIPEDWSPLLKDFLSQCFQRNPADRPSAEALSEHDWLKEHCDVHRVLRPKDSIPFLRRVSQDLQRPPDAVRFVNVEGPRSDSRASVEPPRRSEERSASPATSGLPGSPPKNRLSTGPATPRSPESEVTMIREHSFVKTAFGKPLLCRVCMQAVKKHAVVCEECALIAHARCAPSAPPTCGIRAQLLQIANYPPSPDSPQALEIFRQLTPSSSPLPDSVLSSKQATPAQEEAPPTAFKMFSAFRRSRSSLTNEQDKPRKRTTSISQTSGEGSNESVLASHVSPQVNARPTRPTVLMKPAHARPISMSSDNMTQNRGSHRSAETTTGSIDLSDDSYSQAHSHSQSHSHSQYTTYTYSRSQSALDRSRSRGPGERSAAATPLGPANDGDTETEADAATQYAPSRFSMAVSAADSNDPRRASVLAAPSVGGYGDYEDDELERHAAERAWRLRARRHESRPSAGGEKEKGCVLQ
ncbi:CDC15_1 [Sanghuangporus sanghuang]